MNKWKQEEEARIKLMHEVYANRANALKEKHIGE